MGILNTLVVVIQILVFGPTETIRLIYGILSLGNMVEVSKTVSGVGSLFMGVWLGALVIKASALFFMTTWGIETVFELKGLKWRFAVNAVILGIALGFMRGSTYILELPLVEIYLILPFSSVCIPTLWGVSRWKKRKGSRNGERNLQ